MELSKRELEEIEQTVDRAFLKVCGRTFREPDGDTLEKIKADFPALFVTQGGSGGVQ